jgi:hypothetical protein
MKPYLDREQFIDRFSLDRGFPAINCSYLHGAYSFSFSAFAAAITCSATWCGTSS